MITNTWLISDGLPIFAGIATGVAVGLPPEADAIFSARSQWLLSYTCVVITPRVELLGMGTMLTVPRSWWVLKSYTPNSFPYEFSAVFVGGAATPKPVVPMPLSLATSSSPSAASKATELGAYPTG